MGDARSLRRAAPRVEDLQMMVADADHRAGGDEDDGTGSRDAEESPSHMTTDVHRLALRMVQTR